MSDDSAAEVLGTELEIGESNISNTRLREKINEDEGIELGFVCALPDATVTHPEGRPKPLLSKSVEQSKGGSSSLLGGFTNRLLNGGGEPENPLLIGLVTDRRLVLGSTVGIDEFDEYEHARFVSAAAAESRLTVRYDERDTILEFDIDEQSTDAETIAAALDEAMDQSPRANPGDTGRPKWLAEQEASLANGTSMYLRAVEAEVCRGLMGLSDLEQAADRLSQAHTAACLLGTRAEYTPDQRRLDALVERIDEALAFLDTNGQELAAVGSGQADADEAEIRSLLNAAADAGFAVTEFAKAVGVESDSWTIDGDREPDTSPSTPVDESGTPAAQEHSGSGDTTGADGTEAASTDETERESDPAQVDGPDRSALTEFYAAFCQFHAVLDVLVTVNDDHDDPTPTERWRDAVDEVISGGGERPATGYGSQQAARASATAGEYREAYGNGRAVTSFEAIEVSPLPEYVPDGCVDSERRHAVRPHAPKSGEPLPVLVESEAELAHARRLLTEFPEKPPVGYP